MVVFLSLALVFGRSDVQGQSADCNAFPGGGRIQVPDGVTCAFPPGTSVVGAVIYITQDTNWFKALNCAYTRDQNVSGGVLIGGAAYPALSGELRQQGACQFNFDADFTALMNGTAQPRQATGDGNTLQFASGATVFGFRITLNDGRRWNNCAMISSQDKGWVLSGVIAPFQQELDQQRTCDLAHPDAVRQLTGDGGKLTFPAGSNVLGASIVLMGGAAFTQCFMTSAPQGGTVTSGNIEPKPDEIPPGIPICH